MENLVILIGNVGVDPVIKEVNGHKVLNLPLATTKKINDEEKTQWHHLVFWNKTAELATQYIKKGNKIYIRGELDYRMYEDEAGKRQYKTEIVVYKFEKV